MKLYAIIIALAATAILPLNVQSEEYTRQPSSPVDHWLVGEDGRRIPENLATGIDFLKLQNMSLEEVDAFCHDGSQTFVNLTEPFTIKSNIPSVLITLKPSVPAEGESLTQESIDQLYELFTARHGYYGNVGSTELKNHWFDVTFQFKGNGYYPDIEETDCQLRGRGNSTWMDFFKKPFRLKFKNKFAFEPTDKDNPVFTKIRKSKNHVFIANYVDHTLMRNAAAMKIAELAGVKYVNHMVPVNIYFRLDGSDDWYYNGCYNLTEKYGISSSSVDIDETKGVLIELDGSWAYEKEKYNWGDEVSYSGSIMIKDPDLDEIYEDELKESSDSASVPTAQQRADLWKEDYKEYQLVARDKSDYLEEYLDIRSAVRYLLVFNLTLNTEISYPKSVFLYKRGRGVETLPENATEEEIAAFNNAAKDEFRVSDREFRYVYHFGPVWDFDATFNYTWKANTDRSAQTGLNEKEQVFGPIIRHSEFKKIWDEEWENFKTNSLPALYDYLDAYMEVTETAAEQNGLEWTGEPYHTSTNLRENAAKLKKWIEERVEYISTSPTHGFSTWK